MSNAIGQQRRGMSDKASRTFDEKHDSIDDEHNPQDAAVTFAHGSDLATFILTTIRHSS
jgi:hypothetical protein